MQRDQAQEDTRPQPCKQAQKDDEDDDMPMLSLDTLQILNAFYAENEEIKFLDMTRLSGTSSDPWFVDNFCEDWQLSQFWYSNQTADTIAREVYALVSAASPQRQLRIACVSTPSVFRALRRLGAEQRKEPGPDKKLLLDSQNIYLFEYDERFKECYGEQFIFYDYKTPESFRAQASRFEKGIKGTFDVLVVDPPFLSEECHQKVAQTIEFLQKSGSEGPSCVLVLSGEIMGEFWKSKGLHQVEGMEIEHARNLGNPFCCWSNYAVLVLSDSKKK